MELSGKIPKIYIFRNLLKKSGFSKKLPCFAPLNSQLKTFSGLTRMSSD